MHTSVVILAATASLNGMVGVITFNYPPSYLSLSPLWAAVHIMASVTISFFLVFRKRWLAVVSGALAIGAALFRAGAIMTSVGHVAVEAFTNNDEPLRSSFVIASLTWALIALLLWAVWPLAAISLMEKDDE